MGLGAIEQRGQTMSETNVPIACTLRPDEFRTRRSEHLVEVGESLLERVELPDGYSFCFPGERFDRLAGIVGMERRCCSFLRFVLTADPPNDDLGFLNMTVTDPDGNQLRFMERATKDA